MSLIAKFNEVGTLRTSTAADANTIPVRDSDGGVTHAKTTASILALSGALKAPPKAITSAATLDDTHCVILASAASAGYDVTLAAAASANGQLLFVTKTDANSNAITFKDASANTIATLSAQGNWAILIPDGTSWYKLAGS